MSTYFLDTSAIVKRYVPAEKGHAWMVRLYDPSPGHKLCISQVAFVEVVAAMCRKAREQGITIAERDRLISTFRQDIQDIYFVRPVTTAMYTDAGDLCLLHPLRAYDAVQLACVLDLRKETLANGVSAPIFVCADANLTSIATREGMSVENPNQYPAE